MQFFAGQLTLVYPCVGVYIRTSLMGLSLFLYQCLACLVCLTWMVCAGSSSCSKQNIAFWCTSKLAYPVSWGCRICWLHLWRWVTPTIECPGYDAKQSDVEFPVRLELWGMQNTSSLPSLPDPLWPRVIAPDRVLSMGQIELFDISTLYKQMTNAKFNSLK